MTEGLIVFAVALVLAIAIDFGSGWLADRSTFPDEYDWRYWRKHRRYKPKAKP